MLKETLFCEVISLFENTKIVGNDGSWKPVQTGIITNNVSNAAPRASCDEEKFF